MATRHMTNDSHLLLSHINVIIKSILVLLCLNASICDASVVQLNVNNFEEYTSKYELVFLNFYADWCRFSQILAPVFEEAYAKVLKEFPEPGKVLFGKVDCERETTLGTRFHISKYPTLKLIMNGKVMKREFRGQRSVDAITQHAIDILKDPIQALMAFDSNKVDETKPALIAYAFSGPNVAAAEYNLFRRVSIDLRDDCHFYWISGDPTIKQLEGKTHAVYFKPARAKLNEKDLSYPGVLHSYDELSSWATDKCIPLVREITFENAEELTEEGLPFVILFHNPDDKTSIDLYNKVVQTELQTETGNVNFLIADGVRFAHPLHHLGKTQKDLPLIAIDSFRHMYLFPNFNDIKIPGKLKTFIQDLYSGKLHREFHFGPDPTTNQIVDTNQLGQTNPPESTFRKLAPSRNRYTLLRDEL